MGRNYSAKQKKLASGIKGANEVIELLKEIGKRAEDVLSKAAEEGGKVALKDAKKRCPVRTGKLKRSLHLKKGRKKRTKADVKIQPGRKQYYATFVELGTKRMSAQPFMRPAVDENLKKISKTITKEVSDILRGII